MKLLTIIIFCTILTYSIYPDDILKTKSIDFLTNVLIKDGANETFWFNKRPVVLKPPLMLFDLATRNILHEPQQMSFNFSAYLDNRFIDAFKDIDLRFMTLNYCEAGSGEPSGTFDENLLGMSLIYYRDLPLVDCTATMLQLPEGNSAQYFSLYLPSWFIFGEMAINEVGEKSYDMELYRFGLSLQRTIMDTYLPGFRIFDRLKLAYSTTVAEPKAISANITDLFGGINISSEFSFPSNLDLDIGYRRFFGFSSVYNKFYLPGLLLESGIRINNEAGNFIDYRWITTLECQFSAWPIIDFFGSLTFLYYYPIILFQRIKDGFYLDPALNYGGYGKYIVTFNLGKNEPLSISISVRIIVHGPHVWNRDGHRL